MKIPHNIRSTNKLPIDIKLWNRWPHGVRLYSLSNSVVVQNIDGGEVTVYWLENSTSRIRKPTSHSFIHQFMWQYVSSEILTITHHWGKALVPFINRTTFEEFTNLSIISFVEASKGGKFCADMKHDIPGPRHKISFLLSSLAPFVVNDIVETSVTESRISAKIFISGVKGVGEETLSRLIQTSSIQFELFWWTSMSRWLPKLNFLVLAGEEAVSKQQP